MSSGYSTGSHSPNSMTMRSITPTPLRMPPDVKAYLKAQAVKNERSLNTELLHRLQKTIAIEQSATGACPCQQ